jgi:hypothetical protein
MGRLLALGYTLQTSGVFVRSFLSRHAIPVVPKSESTTIALIHPRLVNAFLKRFEIMFGAKKNWWDY